MGNGQASMISVKLLQLDLNSELVQLQASEY